MASRRVALLPVLVALSQSPGCLPPPPRAPDAASSLCASGIDACEQELVLAASRGQASEPLARALTAAWRARSVNDPWAALAGALEHPSSSPTQPPHALVVREAGATATTSLVAQADVPALPSPAKVSREELFVALAAAHGYEQIVWASPSGVRRVFPRDPLAPWVAGLVPVVTGAKGDPQATLERDLAAESALRAAFAAAAAFRYPDAAEAATKLAEAIDPQRTDEVAARARLALQTLGSSGLVLDADEELEASMRPGDAPLAPADPALDASDTPYGSLARVLLARDESSAYAARRARILAGVSPERHAAFEARFARAGSCAVLAPPPFDDERDLLFAGRLAASFPRESGSPENAGQLPYAEWRRRYERLVEVVVRKHLGWSFLYALVAERGEVLGASLVATETYGRVTDLALAHLAAATELQARAPAKYRAFTQLGLLWSPGFLSDERLQGPLLKLTQASVAGRISAAKDAGGLLVALLAGGAAALSSPSPGLQGVELKAVLDAAEKRLDDATLPKSGWAGAALFALDGAYRLSSGERARAALSFGRLRESLAPIAGVATDEEALQRVLLTTGSLASLGLRGGASGDEAALVEVRSALDGLGPLDAASKGVRDDLASFALRLGSVLVAGLEAGARAKPAAACEEKPGRLALDGKLRDRLSTASDLRRRVLANPAYRAGESPWIRRARLVTTMLSDVLDLAIASDAPLRTAAARGRKKDGARAPVAFTVSDGELDHVLDEALRDLPNRSTASLVTGLYGLVRAAASADDAQAALVSRTADLRRVVTGVFGLLRGDAKGRGSDIALVDRLEKLGLDLGPTADLATALTAYAAAFYAAGDPDHGDVCLLGVLLSVRVTHARVPPAVLELAARSKSRVAWLARFTEEVQKTPPERPDTARYADDMRKAVAEACGANEADGVLGVMKAAVDFAAGGHAKARAALDRVLDDADKKGISAPRMDYSYEEKTATKTVKLSFDMSFASGLLHGSNSLLFGFGFRSPGEPESALSVSLAPRESARAGEEAAKLYVFAASLATVYHLLDGANEAAILDAGRVVQALSAGLRLGERTLAAEHAAAWGSDARALLVLAAELAGEAGQPFLAGDLWTVARQSFAAENPPLDAAHVAALLDDLPAVVRGLPEIEKILPRARRSLRVIASREPCGAKRPDVAGFEAPSCDAYPLSLSLRIGDALPKLPRLRGGGACGWASLDTFLGQADKSTYDPDVFLKAVEDLRASGRVYDAGVMLARQRRKDHCSKAVVVAARALGNTPVLPASLRADLLTVAFNCGAANVTPEVLDDVAALDAVSKRLPDPSRSLGLAMSLAYLGASAGRWELLARLVDEPDFVSRWQRLNVNATAWSLLLDHAARAATGKHISVEATRGARDLACDTLRSKERADTCDAIDALATPAPATKLAEIAKAAVDKLVAALSAPGSKSP